MIDDLEGINALPATANSPLPPLAEPFYRVTIERVEEHHTIKRPWQQVLSSEAFAEAKKHESRPEQFDYRPCIGVEVTRREVLKAEVSDLDLKRVVLAVHSIEVPNNG